MSLLAGMMDNADVSAEEAAAMWEVCDSCLVQSAHFLSFK
jgi:hypothetical protein